MRKSLLSIVGLMSFAALLSGAPAFAQEALMTGGKLGDYYQYFAPPLIKVLDRAWADATIQVSDGTPASMDYLLEHPLSYALAQGNVYADLSRDPKYQGKFRVLPATIGNEAVIGILSPKLATRSQGSWAVIAKHARQVRFAVAPVTSGPGRTFQELMTLDPKGLGEATHVQYFGSLDDAIKAVNDGEADATLMVQFPNPQNSRFKAIVTDHLTMVPVVTGAMRGLDIPGVGPAFTLCENAAVAPDTEISTACSPILVITGASNDNPDLDKVFHNVKPEDFTPPEPGFAKLWKRMKAAGTATWEAAQQKADDLAGKFSQNM